MNSLMSRIRVIEAATTNRVEKGEDNGNEDLDDFGRMKRSVAIQIREIRETLNERNQLMDEDPEGNRTKIAKVSAAARKMIKDVKEDAERLNTLTEDAPLKKKKKDKKKKKEENEEDSFEMKEKKENHKEIVELVFKHIEECETWEKKREVGMTSTDVSAPGSRRKDLFESKRSIQTPLETELDDIELGQRMQMIRKRDQEIDGELAVISRGVKDLKEMATTMGEELEIHNQIIDEIDHKVDITTQHITNVNKKMRETLEKVRSGDKFCVDFILVVIILCLVYGVYSSLSAGKN